MDIASNVSGVLGDVATAAEEFAEDALATAREETVEDELSSEPDTEKMPSYQLTKPKEFSVASFVGSLSINLILPFINGLMLGFGEIIAHEIGFHYKWVGAKVYRPKSTHEQKTKLL